MQYFRGLSALRQDPAWGMKLLTATIVSLIPVVGPIVLTGWTSLMLRRAVSGQNSPLPRLEFDMDLGMKLLQIGFKGFIVQLIWSLPISMIAGAFGGCMGFAAAFAGAMEGQHGGDPGPIFPILMLACLVLVPIVIIPLTLPLHMANLRTELTDDIKAGMEFKEVLGMTRKMWKELLVGSIVLQIIGTVAVIIGLLSCYTLLFPAMAILRIIYTYWLAQVYQRYLEKGGAPLSVGPLEVEPPMMMPQRT